MNRADIVRPGTDVTLIGHGAMVSVLHQAAEIAAGEGVSIEIVDLRSLSPLDYDTILGSVKKTGRAVVAQEAPGNVSVGSEIAATITEKAFYMLEAPVLRVSGFDTPFPPAALEGVYLPDADRILDAVDKSLAY
jgi:pyruvate dehydrogenase E1 component beta subunit